MPKFHEKQFDISPDGYYGPDQEYGGRYVPEVLRPALEELESAFNKYRNDNDFLAELNDLRTNFVGRPSPLIYAKKLTEKLGGAQIYLKNEGNNLTGSHKINHCVYQILLAKRMGKTKVICETGAGQHGLATAIVCAKFGMECVVHMGRIDMQKQYPNVFFMKQMGAKFVEVTTGNQRLTEAVDSALGDFISNPDSYLLSGSALGPSPYPEIMREAQKIVGEEIKTQLSKNPDLIIACIGGGSNAIGAFNAFLYDENTRLIGVEAGGESLTEIGKHSARFASGQSKIGILEGFKSRFLMDSDGQVLPVGGISAGLGYVGIGPLHAYLESVGRLEITSASDKEVLEAFRTLCTEEGLIVALESCHAVVEAIKQAPKMQKDEVIVVNLSGRGDNYLFNIAKGLKDKDFEKFCQEFRLS